MAFLLKKIHRWHFNISNVDLSPGESRILCEAGDLCAIVQVVTCLFKHFPGKWSLGVNSLFSKVTQKFPHCTSTSLDTGFFCEESHAL